MPIKLTVPVTTPITNTSSLPTRGFDISKGLRGNPTIGAVIGMAAINK